MKIDFRLAENVEKIRRQDSAIFTQLVESYSKHLFFAAKGLGLSDFDAEEMACKTWETFFEIAPKFQGKSHVRTFLFGIFYNKVREHKRSSFKDQLKDPIEDVLESRFATDGHWSSAYTIPSQDLEQGQYFLTFKAAVSECLENLPELQKQVFMHKHLVENDNEEICEILEVKEANLRQLLVRGKVRLRECLEKKDYGISS